MSLSQVYPGMPIFYIGGMYRPIEAVITSIHILEWGTRVNVQSVNGGRPTSVSLKKIFRTRESAADHLYNQFVA